MKTFEEPVRIRIHDVDAAGIVFFARYYVLMHDVYESFLEAIGHGIPAAIDAGAIIIPVVESGARYFRPLRHGETITARLFLTGLKKTSYTVRVEFHGADGVHRSTLFCRHVCVDAKAMKPTALPPAMHEALAAYLHEGVEA